MTRRWSDIVPPSKEEIEFERQRHKEWTARKALEEAASKKIRYFVKEYLDVTDIDFGQRSRRDYHWYESSYTYQLRPILVDDINNHRESGTYYAGSVYIGPRIDRQNPAKKPLDFRTEWHIQYRRAFPPKPENTHWATVPGMIQEGLETILDQLGQEFVTRRDAIGPIKIKHPKSADEYSGLIAEKAQRLIVINQAIPVTKDFVPYDNHWKKLAELLGPLDNEIYNMFHDRSR